MIAPMHLCFPSKILEQHLVVLGKTGAGKSSALRHIVEHLLSHNKRVCVVDPKGDWWGLKSSADGKHPGYPIIAFGDFKNANASDVPINEMSGKHIAELISTGNRPCIIGFRGWMTSRMVQFWIDFASTLFNANAGELYLVIDEVHHFAPKGKIQDPQAGKCLHWSNRLMNEGRGIGLVNLIASQRPQKVHNDTLTACETLVAMRVIHKADRDAVEDWIKGCGDPVQGKEVLNSLANMARGEAFVWSPEVGFGPRRLAFPMFETFDSFAPPQLQKKINERSWADVDLTEVREKLATVIEKAKSEDPRELKRVIADLRKERSELQRCLEEPNRQIIERIEIPVLGNGALDRIENVLSRATAVVEAFPELAEAFKSGAQIIAGEIARTHNAVKAITAPESSQPVIRTAAPSRVLPPTQPKAAPENSGSIEFSPTAKQQQILDTLAWYESIGNTSPSNLQVGAVALIDPTGGHFSNTVGPLSSNGLIERAGGVIRLTDAGRALARPLAQIGTLAEYHDMLRERVRRVRSASGKTIEILNSVIARGGADVSSHEIGEEIGIDVTGGHFSNSIGPLGTLGLIKRNRGIIRPTEILFPPGL